MSRFSKRLSAFSAAESQFSELVSARRASDQLLDLTISNPTVVFDEYPHTEIAEALGSIPAFRYDPNPFGIWEARVALAADMNNVDASRLALTAGTSEAYSLLFKLLCDPGDEVLVPTPSYPLFDYLAQLESVVLKTYHLCYDGAWFVDLNSLQSAIAERTKAVIVVNPNNPTGSFLQQSESERLVSLANQHGFAIISDEVFRTYTLESSGERITTFDGERRCLNFTLNGLSKQAGMPQMKLAWIGINGSEEEVREACARLELMMDTYLSVGAPVQLAIQKLLAIGDGIRERILSRVRENLGQLDRMLANAAVHRLHCEGGWSAILRVPQILTEEEWITRLLVEQAVVVQPGYFFDLSEGAFLVLSLITPPGVFDEGVKRILQFATRL